MVINLEIFSHDCHNEFTFSTVLGKIRALLLFVWALKGFWVGNNSDYETLTLI